MDKWSVEHVEEKTTETTNLVEKYEGQVEIEMCSDQKYLGFIISSTGDNLANIRAVRNKSNGIIRKISSSPDLENSALILTHFFESC